MEQDELFFLAAFVSEIIGLAIAGYYVGKRMVNKKSDYPS